MSFVVVFTLLIASIFWVDNFTVYRIFYTALTLALLTLMYNTFIICTVEFEISPWHSSGKVAYLVVMVEALWLLAINAIMALLKHKIYISADQLILPFATALILGFYLIFYVNPPLWLCIGGAIISAILFITTIVLFFVNFEKSILGR